MLTETRHVQAGPGQLTIAHALTDDDAAGIRELVTATAFEYETVDNDRFLADVAVIAHGLPRAVRETLNRARLDDRKHAIVISGNHVGDDLEPTPRHWSAADTSASRGSAFLAMIYAALLGDAIGWAGQQDGRLITDVLPTPGQEDSLLSCGSRTMLGWHTEDAFSPSRGDYIGLFCLRNPTDTPTTVSYLDPARIDDDTLDVLQQARFRVRPDLSHVGYPRTGLHRAPVPLLSGPRDALVLRVDRDFTVAQPGDGEAAVALRRLVAHLDANLYSITLSPGDLCFLDNRNVVHGREPFTPRYDGTDRWLKRVNVVSDLRRTRTDRRVAATRIIG